VPKRKIRGSFSVKTKKDKTCKRNLKKGERNHMVGTGRRTDCFFGGARKRSY